MLGTSWECHKVREFALRPMGDFYWCWTLESHGLELGPDRLVNYAPYIPSVVALPHY